jgi:2-polyprenyl-6-methoxyphenol hydroxylase-like FAD-dependent oxidoreductase
LLIRQADVEAVLDEALVERGVEVERGREVAFVTTSAEAAKAVVRGRGAVEELDSRFIVGCDGPDSIVRDRVRTMWRGAPHRHEVVLADLELEGDLDGDVLHAVPAAGGLLFLFALGERATWRLLATRPADGASPDARFGQPGPGVSAGELQVLLDAAGLGATITEVGWSAQVALQHRLADRFRAGPVFIAGDAAHAHSPAGGLGMNLGIGDATNLGWKLALDARSCRPAAEGEPLLSSYEAERRPVARRVVAMTRLIFWAEAATDPVARLARAAVRRHGGAVLPGLLRRRALVAAGVRTLSQLRAGYPHSPISAEGATARRLQRPGSRLGDEAVTTRAGCARLHALTAAPAVHVLLQRDAPVPPGAAGEHVQLHRLLDRPGNGVVAVRPDGYVGFRSGTAEDEALGRWLDLVRAVPRRPDTPGNISQVP